MPNVQVRDLPEPVHRELVRQAEQAGQSLQQYLSIQLAHLAGTPTLDDVLDRIERRPKGRVTGQDAADALDDERARR